MRIHGIPDGKLYITLHIASTHCTAIWTSVWAIKARKLDRVCNVSATEKATILQPTLSHGGTSKESPFSTQNGIRGLVRMVPVSVQNWRNVGTCDIDLTLTCWLCWSSSTRGKYGYCKKNISFSCCNTCFHSVINNITASMPYPAQVVVP